MLGRGTACESADSLFDPLDVDRAVRPDELRVIERGEQVGDVLRSETDRVELASDRSVDDLRPESVEHLGRFEAAVLELGDPVIPLGDQPPRELCVGEHERSVRWAGQERVQTRDLKPEIVIDLRGVGRVLVDLRESDPRHLGVLLLRGRRYGELGGDRGHLRPLSAGERSSTNGRTPYGDLSNVPAHVCETR